MLCCQCSNPHQYRTVWWWCGMAYISCNGLKATKLVYCQFVRGFFFFLSIKVNVKPAQLFWILKPTLSVFDSGVEKVLSEGVKSCGLGSIPLPPLIYPNKHSSSLPLVPGVITETLHCSPCPDTLTQPSLLSVHFTSEATQDTHPHTHTCTHS